MPKEESHFVTAYGRLSFPKLSRAEAFKAGDAEKFSAALLFPKEEIVEDKRDDGTPNSPWGRFECHDTQPIQDLIDEFLAAKFGKKIPKKLKLPLKDGDDEDWDGYSGHMFIRTTANANRPPRLLSLSREEVTGSDIDKVFYPGCWVRAIVNPFSYKVKGNEGISLGLQLLQFVRDDTPFTGVAPGADALPDLPEEDLAPDDLDDLD